VGPPTRVDFLGGQCFNCLSKELGFGCPYHNFQVFVRFLFVLIRGDKYKQFRAIPFPSAFEKFFPLGVATHVPLFE